MRLVATKRDEVRYMAFMRQYACEGLTRGLRCAYEVIDVLHGGGGENGVFSQAGALAYLLKD